MTDRMIDRKHYPELDIIMWDRADRFVAPETALYLYETRWRFIAPNHLGEPEKALVNWLVKEYGQGVLLTA